MLDTPSRLKLLPFQILSAVILLYPFWIANKEGKRCERCEVSFMFPNFVDLSSNLAKSPQAYKYKLFRYYDGWKDEWRREENCTPVLFVPGSAGHYKQVRSLASSVLNFGSSPSKRPEKMEKACFQFYTVNFMDEFVAFDANLIQQQASYVNEAAKLIAQGHSQFTDSIIMVGHSFGGVVLRMAQLLDNYPGKLLPTFRPFFITLASPHIRPPLHVSYALDSLYESIQDKPIHISISSGPFDTLVPASLSIMNGLTDEQVHIINLRAGDLSSTNSNPNHLAMVWDQTLMSGLAILFHSITKHGRLRPGKEIEGRVQALMASKREEKHIKPLDTKKIHCDSIQVASATTDSPWKYTRQDFCGRDHSKKYVCIQFPQKGHFQLATGLEYPLGFDVFVGQAIKEQTSGEYFIDTPKPLSYTTFPGKTVELPTITGITTGFTQITTKILVESEGVLLLRINCEDNVVFGHTESEWSDLISDWHLWYNEFRDNLPVEVALPQETMKKSSIGPAQLLLGKLIRRIGPCTTLDIDIKPPSARSVSLEFTSSSPIIGIMSICRDGSRRYSTVHSQLDKQYLVLEPDVEKVQVSFWSHKEGWLKIRPRLLHTFVISLIEDPNRLGVELYAAAVLTSSGLSFLKALLILLVRDMILEYPNGLISIVTTLARSFWATVACFILVMMLRHKYLRRIGSKSLLFITLLALLPITPSIKITIQYLALLGLFHGMTTDTFTLFVALFPNILQAIFDIRNAMNLGWRTFLLKEHFFTLVPSVLCFIAPGEVLARIVEIHNQMAKENNHGGRVPISRIWAIVIAAISHLLTKPYFLPIVHVTIILSRIE